MVNQSVAPVFLVGASRCGTTLLVEALCRHKNIHISSETHWFDDDRCQRTVPVESDDDRKQVQDWFMSLAHRPFGHFGDPEKGWLDRDTFERSAQEVGAGSSSEKSRDHYFHAYCELDAGQHDKGRWGEKTPRHVFRIDEILGVFPNAKIVCSMRDPRAMVLSYRNWSRRESHDLYTDDPDNATLAREKRRSRASYHPVIASLLWRAAFRAASKSTKERGDGTITIVKYEDLVTNPEDTLHGLSDWLNEPFDATMLGVPIVNSSFDDFKAGAGFNKDGIDRWQTQLSRSELAVIRLLCRREMEELGYKVDKDTPIIWPLYALPHLLTVPVAVYRAWRANRDRTGNLFSYVWRRISV